MSDPFMAEIRIFSFSFPPRGWAQCDGQLLPISQNQALFSLLGATYGGDGITNFALPDLRGRVPISFSSNFALGSKDGDDSHILTAQEMPGHNHTVSGSSSNVDTPNPVGGIYGNARANAYMKAQPSDQAMHPNAAASAGESQPHPNMQPYLTLNYCIALMGIYPSRN